MKCEGNMEKYEGKMKKYEEKFRAPPGVVADL